MSVLMSVLMSIGNLCCVLIISRLAAIHNQFYTLRLY